MGRTSFENLHSVYTFTDIILLFKLKFVDKVLSEWENPDSKQPKTLKNIIYAEMIQTKILPEVKKLFSELLVQDDEARIHRTWDLRTLGHC